MESKGNFNDDVSDEIDLWSNEKTENENTADLGQGNAHTHNFSSFPDSAVDVEEENDTSELIDRQKHAVWSFAFYQALFDVDTSVVLNRIKGSLIPLRSNNFSRNYIGGKPDLYGPFWICTTLIVTILICGNLTTLLSHFSDSSYHYTPQFERLSIAAIIIYGYTGLIPLFLKAFLYFKRIQSNFSYMDIMCTYGYSMFVFIPLSILLLIPSSVVDWLLVCLVASISGVVIVISLLPVFEDSGRIPKLLTLSVVFLLHFAFALTFRMYFFSNISLLTESNNSTTTIRTTTAHLAAKSEINLTT